jgi:hypothetical protein
MAKPPSIVGREKRGPLWMTAAPTDMMDIFHPEILCSVPIECWVPVSIDRDRKELKTCIVVCTTERKG